MNSIDYYINVRKDKILTVCGFFETFEGLTAIRTPNPKEGDTATLQIMVTPDRESEFKELLKMLGGKIELSCISPEDI